MKAFLEWANRQLAALPGIPFKIVQLAALDFVTYCWAVTISFVKDTSDGVPVFNSWLFFLAALHGVNLGAYVTAKFKSGAANTVLPSETGEYPLPVPPPPPVAGPPVVTTTTTTNVTQPPVVSP